jgi:hypothetical protein
MSRFETYLDDVACGVVVSLLGALVGYLILLIGCSLCFGTMPNGSDIGLFPIILIFEFPVASVIVPFVRAFISTNRVWLWMVGWFVFGAIVNPISLYVLLCLCVGSPIFL